MPFQRTQLTTCPKCKADAVFVIESRSSLNSRRRRKQCSACNYKYTTHEVSQEFFQYAQHAIATLARLKEMVGAQTEPNTTQREIKCFSCNYSKQNGCSFGFPEYNTEESFDCTQYQFKNS